MIDDAVYIEEVHFTLDVLLFVVVTTDNEQFGVGPGHASEGVFRIQGGEDPTAAVGGGNDIGFKRGKHLGVHAQTAPYRHALPVDAEALLLQGAEALINPLFEFFKEQVIGVDGLLGAPTHDGRAHQGRTVKKGQGGGFGSGCGKAFLPKIRAFPGKGHRLLELVHIQFPAGNLFQGFHHLLHLFGYGVDVGIRDVTNPHIGVYPHYRHVEFFTVPVEPVLHVTALVGVEDQDIWFGRALDTFKYLGKRGDPFQKSTDVGGEVGADIGRITNGIGFGDQVGGHARCPQHG